jgi:hypothetical protein
LQVRTKGAGLGYKDFVSKKETMMGTKWTELLTELGFCCAGYIASKYDPWPSQRF